MRVKTRYAVPAIMGIQVGPKITELILSKREHEICKRASDIAFQVREKCREYGFETSYGCDDLADDPVVFIDMTEEPLDGKETG